MEIRELIQKLAKEPIIPFGLPCIVLDVAPSGTTCTCRPVNGEADIEGVRLQAEGANGILMTPTVGSAVIVHMINDAEAYVTMFSALDAVKYFDGSFGGLTKTQELKTQLDKNNEVLTAIMNTLTSWSPVANDGGAALKTAITAALSGKTVGDFANIENTKITHG